MAGRKAIVTVILLVLLVFSLFMPGCKNAARQAVPESPKDDTSLPPQELVIGIGRNFYEGPESAVFLHGSTGVWESLTYLSEDMLPKPQLALSLTPNQEATRWTVRLRPGVRFHDGTPLTAEVVKANVDRVLKNPKFDSYGTFLKLEKAEVSGEMEIVFVFSQPEPAFPLKVNYHGFPVFSPASFDADGKITVPYGSGPFKYYDYIKDEALILVRNEDYWGEKPRLEKVTFKPVPDPSTRLAALQAGEIDAIADVGGVLPVQAAIVEKDPGLELRSRLVTTTHYLLFNNQKPPFNQTDLRRAVSLVLDRQLVVNELLAGYGEPADCFFTPLAREYVVRGLWQSDRQKAQVLAAGAGGQKVLLLVSSALANRWPYKPLAEILQAKLSELGLQVEIQMLEAGAWAEALKNGNYNLTLTPYTFMTGDPDFVFGRWLLSGGQMNISRGLGYSNAEVDRLTGAAAMESDPVKRKELYALLQEIVSKEVPMAPVFHDVTLYAYRKKVKDLTLDAYFRPSLEKAWIAAH